MDFSGQESSGIKILLAFEQIAVYTDFCEITDFIRSGIAQSKHYNLIKLIKEKVLRGRVQFPTGGIVRDPLQCRYTVSRKCETAAADLVRFQNRQ